MKYQENNDVKAVASFSLAYSSGTVRAETYICLAVDLICLQPNISIIATIYYDAPTPPQGLFDDFLAIPAVQKNVTSRSFYDLVFAQSLFNPPSNVSTRFVTDHVFKSDSNVWLTRYA
jgi:hypothetical protein